VSDRRAARWWLGASLLLLAGFQSASAEVDVETRGGLVTIRARNAPLVQVLARLSQETGLKLIYEGPPPSQVVTVSIEGVAESQVVTRLLEGSGLNYTFQMDPSGTRVEALFLSGGSNSAPASVIPRTPPEETWLRDQPAEGPEAEEPPEPQLPEDERADHPDGLVGPLSRSQGPPGIASPGKQSTESPAPGSNHIPPGPGLTPPSFPGPASQPVPFPRFPAEASNPPPG
jgi:hypothetical protein